MAAQFTQDYDDSVENKQNANLIWMALMCSCGHGHEPFLPLVMEKLLQEYGDLPEIAALMEVWEEEAAGEGQGQGEEGSC